MPVEVVTLVTHHPGRPSRCLDRCLSSLAVTTERSHVIDIRVQGETDDVEVPFNPVDGLQVQVTGYSENVYTARPRIESVALALAVGARYWAKLDDDMELDKGAWDVAIAELESQNGVRDVACAMVAARNPDGHVTPRRTIEVVNNEAHLVERGNGPGVCGFVGDGCTVFRREFFEAGAEYCPEFRLGGADIDLMMQARAMGWEALLLCPPYASHTHEDCSPTPYNRTRYDAELIRASGAAFHRRWGMHCPHLSRFGARRLG